MIILFKDKDLDNKYLKLPPMHISKLIIMTMTKINEVIINAVIAIRLGQSALDLQVRPQ